MNCYILRTGKIHHAIHGKISTISTGPFSIAMLNYQGVITIHDVVIGCNWHKINVRSIQINTCEIPWNSIAGTNLTQTYPDPFPGHWSISWMDLVGDEWNYSLRLTHTCTKILHSYTKEYMYWYTVRLCEWCTPHLNGTSSSTPTTHILDNTRLLE